MADSKGPTRTAMREQRRRLSPQLQTSAARKLARHLGRQLCFRRARRIALYLPNDGEIDPGPLLRLAVAAGKTTLLPVLDPQRPGILSFVPWLPGQPLYPNRYGIPEPAYNRARRLQPWLLDLVCLPLVAFDLSGNRLGMGGGFYGRPVTPLRASGPRRPLLVGLAHQFQHCDALPADPWDIPLNAIATDTGVTFFPRTTP